MLRVLTIILLIGCAGASYSRGGGSIELGNLFKKNGGQFIDFSLLQGNEWTKVCFLGPYNVQSAKVLGFEWDVTQYTNVLASDGHNVVIFATDKQLVSYIVHNRNDGDFWQLTGKCFPREHSKLYRGNASGAWHIDS